MHIQAGFKSESIPTASYANILEQKQIWALFKVFWAILKTINCQISCI